jgi:hypothetical protein
MRKQTRKRCDHLEFNKRRNARCERLEGTKGTEDSRSRVQESVPLL